MFQVGNERKNGDASSIKCNSFSEFMSVEKLRSVVILGNPLMHWGGVGSGTRVI
jgi:hypothetical protein